MYVTKAVSPPTRFQKFTTFHNKIRNANAALLQTHFITVMAFCLSVCWKRSVTVCFTMNLRCARSAEIPISTSQAL